MGKVRWSDLPEELVDSVANHISSDIDLVHIRSICQPWRSTVGTKKRFQNRFHPYLPSVTNMETPRVLYQNTFLRVTHPSSSSSSPSKGWLIKTRQVPELVSESSKMKLLFPLSRKLLNPYGQTLDLLKIGVSEILQSYDIYRLGFPKNNPVFNIHRTQFTEKSMRLLSAVLSVEEKRDIKVEYEMSRVVLVKDMIFVVDCNNKIWCCKNGEESDRQRKYIESEDSEYFSDIIVHKGQVYALDLKGAIFWIRLSDLKIYQHTSSTPILDYYEVEIYNCKDMRLVDYNGDLCIVHRLCKKGLLFNEKTVKFKVYKMDKELEDWVEVCTLGENALIMAMDKCFTVLASEYHGCLENAIYFIDDNYGENLKDEEVQVFKFDDGSIINMADSSSRSCFQMFYPPFLCPLFL